MRGETLRENSDAIADENSNVVAPGGCRNSIKTNGDILLDGWI